MLQQQACGPDDAALLAFSGSLIRRPIREVLRNTWARLTGLQRPPWRGSMPCSSSQTQTVRSESPAR